MAIGTYYIIWVLLKKWTMPFRLIKKMLLAGQLSREMFYSVQTCFVFAIAALANFYISKKGWGLYYTDVNDYSAAYWWLSLGLMLLINDFHFYWIHRLLHWGPLYMRIHAVHHQSRQTTPLTSQSFHAIESFANMSVVFLFPFLFPLHVSAYVVFSFVAFINNVYGHSGYEFWPNSWLRHAPVNLLNSSSVHSWHHEKVHGNYGLYTTIWDRMFGTFRQHEIFAFGKEPLKMLPKFLFVLLFANTVTADIHYALTASVISKLLSFNPTAIVAFDNMLWRLWRLKLFMVSGPRSYGATHRANSLAELEASGFRLSETQKRSLAVAKAQ